MSPHKHVGPGVSFKMGWGGMSVEA